jgi:hypothetical protein
MAVSAEANKFITETEPFKVVKTDPDHAATLVAACEWGGRHGNPLGWGVGVWGGGRGVVCGTVAAGCLCSARGWDPCGCGYDCSGLLCLVCRQAS